MVDVSGSIDMGYLSRHINHIYCIYERYNFEKRTVFFEYYNIIFLFCKMWIIVYIFTLYIIPGLNIHGKVLKLEIFIMGADDI